MPVEVFNSTTTWTCPAGVTSVRIECWGSGANGASPGQGGGGGAYSKLYAHSVTPSTNYQINIDGPGFDTNFNDTTGPGLVCVANSAIGSLGGSAASSTGDLKYDGGDGGDADAGDPGGGGGGGGSAGPTGAGSNGSNASGTTGGAGATAVYEGGGGGSGGNGGANGVNGSGPGGGGGGGGIDSVGGNGSGGTGAYGRIRLTYGRMPCGDGLGMSDSGRLGGGGAYPIVPTLQG